MAHRDGVVDEVKKVLRLQNWREDAPIYTVLLGHFPALRAGQGDQGRAFLDEAAKKCDSSVWPYPIVRYLRGEIDESKLLAAAIDNDRFTEAGAVLGLDALQKGRVGSALARFHGVKENGNPQFAQYAMSLAELKRLDREQAAGDGR
jgi:lipoprotein NlpI